MRIDARRNREQIVAAAQELIEQKGPAVPLDDIARAAGVGAGTLHRHFPTKQALLAEVVVDRVAGLADQLGGLGDVHAPGDALTAAVALMLDEGDRSAALKAALQSTDFDLRRLAPEAVGRLHAAVAQLLTRAQQAKAIRDDLDTAARIETSRISFDDGPRRRGVRRRTARRPALPAAAGPRPVRRPPGNDARAVGPALRPRGATSSTTPTPSRAELSGARLRARARGRRR